MVSMLDAVPRAFPARGAVSNPEPVDRYTFPNLVGNTFLPAALDRAARPDYPQWLDHVRPAAECTRPIRLSGTVPGTDPTTHAPIARATAQMPDGTIYKACGNRRATVCPSCARTYQSDAYQLLRAGLIGGKGIPTSVTAHPAVFATFTAPPFGTVHHRVVKRHTCRDRRRCDCRAEPCHARTGTNPTVCGHGTRTACFARHETSDPRLGQPLCLDCYDHDHQVVWNLYAGELWRRTKQAIERFLTKLAKRRGIPRVIVGYHPVTGNAITKAPVRVSHGKASEFQIRGAVHFHVLLRLDGVDPGDPTAVVPPPDGFTHDDLDDAIRAAADITFTTPHHPDHHDTDGNPSGWEMAWGTQVDVKPINATGGELTDSMVAGYIAKYATKSTEATGHRSTRLTADDIDDYADHDGDHIARLIAACWYLGRPLTLGTPYAQRPHPVKAGPGFRERWTCQHCEQTTRYAVCLCQELTERANTAYARMTGTAESPADTTAGHTSNRKSSGPSPEDYARLRRWAHMLGFGGHFLTKARRYSVTFAELRGARVAYRRFEVSAAELAEHPQPDGFDLDDTTLIVGSLTFAGVGWHTTADAVLAMTAAALARERRQAGLDAIAHEIGSATTNPPTRKETRP
ncbi:hypothetical protein F4553_003955 [Allocatelliglobosispora scoriae]|uniref:Plasmid replication initiator protein n=1 Tax=Allocatelliglobosispora scoriae TaxID=643052 RepID=A0A841BT43_9ACTN|nr:replication initiator [Allocatelliglobosispora scoriae]MBB5870576.1 hypothetical protein [Allocatelliglobosispora scoriae]